MIFCKSIDFLQETEETLNSHIAFINTVFNTRLQKVEDVCGLRWFTSAEQQSILYMVGHTGDAIRLLDFLHRLCKFGFGMWVKDVYLNTCSAKSGDDTDGNSFQSKSGIVFPSEATDEERRKLKINENNKFAKLDSILEQVKNDSFNVNLCKQDFVVDEKVKMARFLPMDECNLGFSPTNSELLLHGHRGTLSEKLNEAFDTVA